MARKLTKEAKTKVMDDAALYSDLCVLLDVKPSVLSQMVYRNSNKLTNHDAVAAIAASMNKIPDDILEAEPVPTTT